MLPDLKKLAANPQSAVHRLGRRLEKTASVLGAAASGGLVGALPMALINGFMARGGGRGKMLHDATVGALVGGIPGALFGGYGEYQAQKERAKALREYMSRGGYGGEFLNDPSYGPK